jgi:hypothetical protein
MASLLALGAALYFTSESEDEKIARHQSEYVAGRCPGTSLSFAECEARVVGVLALRLPDLFMPIVVPAG